MTPYLPHYPTDRLHLLYVETELQLRSFRTSIDHIASARRARQSEVPPGVLAEARKLLAAVSRLMARETHWRGRLLLRGSPGWAELGVALGLADTALRRFATLYLPDPFDEDDDAADTDPAGADSGRFAPLESRYPPTAGTA